MRISLKLTRCKPAYFKVTVCTLTILLASTVGAALTSSS